MNWLKLQLKKVLQLILKLLSEGFSPSKVAITFALGISIGIIPIVGVNTILLTGLALLLRLNIPLIQILNYTVYPIQLLLYIPFLKLGASVSGNPNLALTYDSIKATFNQGWWQAFVELGQIHMWGIFVWFALLLPFTAVVYIVTIKLFTDLKSNRRNVKWLDKFLSVKGV